MRWKLETCTHFESFSPYTKNSGGRKKDDGIELKFSQMQLTLGKEIGFAESWTFIRSNLTVENIHIITKRMNRKLMPISIPE